MRVFLDANVLFSASDPASATRRLLDAVSRRAEVVSNAHAIEEARRNIAAKRPAHLPEFEKLCLGILTTKGFTAVHLPGLPEEDLPIVAGAVGARCTHLWTSDKKHFGHMYACEIQGVRIVSSILLADELQKAGWNP